VWLKGMKSLSMKNTILWHVIRCNRVEIYQRFQEKCFLAVVEEDRVARFSWPACNFLIDNTCPHLNKQLSSIDLPILYGRLHRRKFLSRNCEARHACVCNWCKQDMCTRDNGCLAQFLISVGLHKGNI
jgi:hypothetical protein